MKKTTNKFNFDNTYEDLKPNLYSNTFLPGKDNHGNIGMSSFWIIGIYMAKEHP